MGRCGPCPSRRLRQRQPRWSAGPLLLRQRREHPSHRGRTGRLSDDRALLGLWPRSDSERSRRWRLHHLLSRAQCVAVGLQSGRRYHRLHPVLRPRWPVPGQPGAGVAASRFPKLHRAHGYRHRQWRTPRRNAEPVSYGIPEQTRRHETRLQSGDGDHGEQEPGGGDPARPDAGATTRPVGQPVSAAGVGDCGVGGLRRGVCAVRQLYLEHHSAGCPLQPRLGALVGSPRRVGPGNDPQSWRRRFRAVPVLAADLPRRRGGAVWAGRIAADPGAVRQAKGKRERSHHPRRGKLGPVVGTVFVWRQSGSADGGTAAAQLRAVFA